MTICLRGHHLLCMLTFVGKGYSTAFTENYHAFAKQLNLGEEIEIIDGPDDLCAPLAQDCKAHCHNSSVLLRDAKALEQVSALLGKVVSTGSRLVPDAQFFHLLREGFANGFLRPACQGCEWKGLCDEVAAQGFQQVLICPPQS